MGALHAGPRLAHPRRPRRVHSRCRQRLRQPHAVRPQRGLRAAIPAPSTPTALSPTAEGADVVFAPSVEELYPNGADSTFVEVPGLSDRLDGQSRPGHFRGVATVVAKLLLAAEPDRAFFGQKDAAQVAVVRRLVADLCLAAEIVVCPIVREPDGLALSSRNAYLTPPERAQALVLGRAVRHVESLIAQGERRATCFIASAHGVFASEPEVRIDYIAFVDWSTLEPVSTAAPGTLFAVAAFVGPTRLIDNAILA